MKINLYKAQENTIYDITEMISMVEWGGDIQSAARTADITVMNAPYDPTFWAMPTASLGDFIGIESEKEIFYGRVYGREKLSENGTVTWNCIDPLQHLLKSTVRYNFKKKTAEAITAQVCADFQFPVGSLAETGIVIPSMICDNSTIYDIIMGAYTKSYKKNGKLYQCLMKDRVLTVIEKGITLGGGFILSEDLNITKSSYTESTESIVNKVKVYNEKGKQIGEVKDDASVAQYGVFQTVYEQEKGIDPTAGAKTLIVGPEQSLSIEVIGDMNCIAGRGVTVKDSATGASGLYWIKSDKHTFQNGIHTMTLELDFKNLMDEKEFEAEKEKGDKK